MQIRKLENIKGENLLKLIKDHCQQNETNRAIELLKKSGICINTFGGGRPNKNEIFKKAIEAINKQENSNVQLKRFIEEINILNTVYKDFNQNHMSTIEENVPANEHFGAYLIALELKLRSLHSELSEENGNISENIIQSTGAILKYFNHKGFKINSSYFSFSKESIEQVKQHFKLASDHLLLSKITELWTYYDIPLQKTGDTYVISSIGNLMAQAKNVSHMTFMDKRIAKMTSDAYYDFITRHVYKNKAALPPNHYNSSNEKTSAEFLMRYLNIPDMNFFINNIPLNILLRAYTVLEQASKDFINENALYSSNRLDEVCIILSKSQWRKKFEAAGIPYKYVKQLMEFMTFSKQSNDLFDCPFIEFEDKLLTVPSVNLNTDSSRAILLNASKNKVNLGDKGLTFEKVILDTLKSQGIKCISKKKHENGTDYECDAIFSMGDTLYLVEIKNWNIPTTYKAYSYYLDDLNKTINQLNRIVDFYLRKDNFNEIQSELEVSNIKRIKKIILTNISVGMNSLNSDIYLIDDTMFRGYFTRTSPKKVETQNLNLTIHSNFEKFYNGEISDCQFNDFINIKPLLDYQIRRLEEYEFEPFADLGIKLKDYTFKNLYIEKV
ncbi:hypothetical protein [Lysinibacillus sphaericus]|uniref:NERD domain-containing protein n=1 Tax=Lysinibacillus sphaericus OT4b.31 TaxID=1285586 RepID=R7ZID9_LYSSH|nr:hypothetical protein [Lysinibacillus sphaericus]EON73848.1 hypothetical protein H131_04264 [Lysinibacillus sphaericus OT4b.31]